MSEGGVRKIQPFTIGTRLSIPSEQKCHDLTDTYLQRNEIQNYESERAAPDMGQSQRGLLTSKPSCVADQVNSLDAQDERAEEDRNSVSSPVCSRSIRKIAICSNAEATSVSPCDCDSEAAVKAGMELSHRADPTEASMGVNRRKISDPQLKVNTWFKRNLEYGCNRPGSPSQDSDSETLSTQQRDLKDIENSLIQLTRSLDDEQKCRATYVDPAQHADLQERSGLRERKKIPSRERNITQTWLRFQTLLRNYHQDLKLALDVSSFYQQADHIISVIQGKRGDLSGSKDQRTSCYTEVKDIESQIMMLEETVSRLSDLHPTLAARVTQKQVEVHESWDLLQQQSRNMKPEKVSTCTTALCCHDVGSSTQTRERQRTEESETHKMMGKNMKEERNRLKEFQVMQVFEIHDKSTPVVKTQPSSCTSVTCDCTSNLHGQIGQQHTRERNEPTACSNTCSQTHQHELGILLQESTSADKTLSWLTDNVAVEPHHQNTEDRDEDKKQTEPLNQVDVIFKRPRFCQSNSEDSCEFHTHLQSNVDMKDRLQSNVDMKDRLQSNVDMKDRLQSNVDMKDPLQSNVDMKDRLQSNVDMKDRLQSNVDMKDRLQSNVDMKDRLQSNVDMKDRLRQVEKLWEVLRRASLIDTDSFDRHNLEIPTRSTSDVEDVSNPMEELLGVLEDLSDAMNEKQNSFCQHPDNPELKCQNVTQILHIKQLLSRCAELSMDTLDAESDMVVRCEPDNSGLEGLQEQHEELETAYRIIKEEVDQMDGQSSHVLSVFSEEAQGTWEHVQTIQLSLEELTRSLAENHIRLQQFRELQDFLRTYLAIISWTDKTCTYIFSDALANQSKLHEVTKSSELDVKIQQKFEEFDEFAAAGQKLITDRHHLTNIINERTDELQSMLGWMLVHWRSKKDQLNQDKPERLNKDVSPSGTFTEPTHQPQCPLPGMDISKHPHRLLSKQRQGAAKICIDRPKVETESHQGQSVNISKYISQQDVVAASPSLVLEDTHTAITPLGGSINLILSFDQPAAVPSQLQASQEQKETSSETVHRVSTYLQVTDGNKVTSQVNKEVKSETTWGRILPSASHRKSSATATIIPRVSSVELPTSQTRSNTLSLNRATKRRKRHTHRHTVTGVIGMDVMDGRLAVPTGPPLRANTWPPEATQEQQAAPKSPVNTELQLYIKNNSVVPVADPKPSRTSNVPSFQVQCVKPSRSTDGHEQNPLTISLGSMLSLDLPKKWEHKSDRSCIDKKLQSRHVDVKFDSPKNQLLNSSRRPCLKSVSSKIIDLQTHSLEQKPEKKDVENIKSESVSAQCLLPLAKDLQCDPCRSRRSLQSSVTLQEIHSREETDEKLSEPQTPSESHKLDNDLIRFPIVFSHDPRCTGPSHNPHKCLSVHTKISDLNGHIYRPFTRKPFADQRDLIVGEVKGFNTGPGGHRSQDVVRSGALIVCSEGQCCLCCGHGVSRAALGKEASPSCSPSCSLGRASDPVHPDHQQFEEEEEELQDIWRGRDRGRAPYSVPQM